VNAGVIFFDTATDTIEVSGQTIIGTASTYEATIMFPSSGGATGVIFNEWTEAAEDKYIATGPSTIQGYNFFSECCLTATVSLAPNVFHHIAFVYDGTEERIYVDGTLVASRSVSTFDVGDAEGFAHIGAIFRDGFINASFIGYLDALQISSVARYTGLSFDPPTGDLLSDGDTQLLYNFNEAPGSTVVIDSGPLSRNGILGVGFDGATSPEFVALVQLTVSAAEVALNLSPEANDDTFTISQATVLLGDGSDGIHPPTEAVTVWLGTSSLTIPPGSFQPTLTGAFVFEGVIKGVALQVIITPLTRATFTLKARGEGAALTGIAVPVPVGLTIGDDRGSALLPVAKVRAHLLPLQRE
jgi:hypothetical protein